MRLRHPAGRAGRMWLEHRVEVATRGASLLDRKRRALVQEHRRLRVLARQTAIDQVGGQMHGDEEELEAAGEVAKRQQEIALVAERFCNRLAERLGRRRCHGWRLGLAWS